MKLKIFLTIFLFLIGFHNYVNAQNVNIPDANFKAALVADTTINTNKDGEIQVTEAAVFADTITVNSLNITDLTGIGAFTLLTGLDCSFNQLHSFDISNNTSLKYLNCGTNLLTSLNVTANTLLTHLDCDNNINLPALNVSSNAQLIFLNSSGSSITSLNVANNTALVQLSCGYGQIASLNVSANTQLSILQCNQNPITSLDVSGNTALTYLDCGSTQISTLNVKNGNNTNMFFSATLNSNLSCIQVDNVAFSNGASNWHKDSGAFYSTNCSTGIVYDDDHSETTIYPNPANGSFVIASNSTQQLTADVYDMNGRHVFNKIFVGATNVNASDFANGVYTLAIKSSLGTTNKKLVITH